MAFDLLRQERAQFERFRQKKLREAARLEREIGALGRQIRELDREIQERATELKEAP